MAIPILTVALALAPLPPQQTGTPYVPYFPDDYLIEWPSAPEFGPGDSFERIAIGQFMSDADQHAVVLRGGNVFTLFSPGVYSQVRTTSLSGVLDFVFLTGTDVSGPDRLAYTTATGLWVADYVESSAGGSDTSDFGAPVLLAGGSWAGCASVKARDIDRDGDLDLFGISGTGSEVLLSRNHGNGTVAAPLSVSLGQPVLDFDAANYDSNLLDTELAVLTASALEIFELTNLQQADQTWTTGAPSLMCSYVQSPGKSRIALATEDAGSGEYELVTVDSNGSDAAATGLSFAYAYGTGAPVAVDPVALVAGRSADRIDGPEDLFLFHRTFGAGIQLKNTWSTGATAHFDGTNAQIAFPSEGAPMSGESVAPFVQYKPLSGDLLGLFPLQADDAIFVHSASSQTGANTATANTLDIAITGSGLVAVTNDDGTDDYELQIEFTLPTVSPAFNAAHDAVQVAVWIETVQNAGIDANESNLVYAIVDPGSVTDRSRTVLVPSASFGYVAGQPQMVSDLHMYLHVRWIKSNLNPTNPSVSQPAADATMGVRLQDSAFGCDDQGALSSVCTAYLEALPTSSSAVELKETPGQVFGAFIGGASVSQDRIVSLSGNVQRQAPVLWGDATN